MHDVPIEEVAATQPAPPKPMRSSIDLSLELERQLDSDSVPNSPAVSSAINNDPAHASLDPQILAHIITQLRDSLTKMTNERDDLITQLAESHSRIAEFKDSLALLTDRCARLESDLETARKQHQDDEEAITMLRSKVEESRRGLMRLQTERNNENKRMTLDLSSARSPSLRASHRTSFAPLTGSGVVIPPSSYRRTTSVNDNDPGFAEFIANLPGSPGHYPIGNENGESSSQNKRRSMFGSITRSSLGQVSANLEGRRSISPSIAEVESLKRDLAATRVELEETRHDLTESNEAREASESCVKALRDYISQMSLQETNTQMIGEAPRPRSNSQADVSEKSPLKTSSGWGLRLWRVDTSASLLSQSSNSQRSPPDNEIASPSTAVPLRDKLGSFFSRGSSSTSSSYPRPEYRQDEPILNGSDVSSLSEASEPISPPQEKTDQVMIRDEHKVTPHAQQPPGEGTMEIVDL